MSHWTETKLFSRAGLSSVSALLLISFLGATYWHEKEHSSLISREPLEREQLRDKGGYRFISPLLECRASNEGSFEQASLIKKQIKKAEEQANLNPDINHLSVYFLDLNEGYWVGYNENERFTPASLMKVPVLIAYLKKAQTEPNLLSQRYVYSHASSAPQASYSFQPSKQLVVGQEYSIEEMLYHMIVYSDNNAVQFLLGRLDPAFYHDVYDDLMISDFYDSQANDYMTVREYSAFFRVLYNASYLNRQMSEKALEILSRSDFQSGLTAGLPEGKVVAHKFGERETVDFKQLHDCGIVYREDAPYLLCVMTRGQDYGHLAQMIQGVSRTIWQTLNSQ